MVDGEQLTFAANSSFVMFLPLIHSSNVIIPTFHCINAHGLSIRKRKPDGGRFRADLRLRTVARLAAGGA